MLVIINLILLLTHPQKMSYLTETHNVLRLALKLLAKWVGLFPLVLASAALSIQTQTHWAHLFHFLNWKVKNIICIKCKSRYCILSLDVKFFLKVHLRKSCSKSRVKKSIISIRNMQICFQREQYGALHVHMMWP